MLHWHNLILLCRVLTLFLSFTLLSLFYLVAMLFSVETDLVVAKHVSQPHLLTPDHLELADTELR